ncbi:MAG: hypothetical protein Q7S79_00715 [bacterium]|nr:hypothetical protein [bacterium]
MKILYLPTSIIISSILVASSIIYGFSIKYGFDLDSFQKVTNIIGSISIFIALATYFYGKEKDKKNLVIEQVSFFRKEVILEGDGFIKLVRSKRGESFVFSRVRLDEPTIESANKNYRKESKEQIKLLRELKTLPEQTQLLNILEEFALRVLHGGTENYSALNALKSPYIELVEINAVVLLQQREFFTGNQSFLNTLKLYALWSSDIDRRTPEQRIREFNAKFSDRDGSVRHP